MTTLTPAPAPRIEIERLTAHPGNVRDDLAIDDAMRASIKERGVRIPLKITQTADGTIRVIDGHRRLAVAIETGQVDVPYETDAGDEADQYIDMYVTAHHRRALTPKEEAAALFGAHEAGAKISRIAKAAGLKTDVVKANVAIGGNARVLRAVEQSDGYEWTLEDLAALAEFADDPEALQRVTEGVARYSVDYALRIERTRRAEEIEAAAERERLAAAGFTLSETEPEGGVPVRYLATTDDEHHVACPHHVMVSSRYNVAHYYAWCAEPETMGHARRPAPTGGNNAAPRRTTDERRAIINGNRHWTAARAVRQDWVATLLNRRAQPKTTSAVMARKVAGALLGTGRTVLDNLGGNGARAMLDHAFGAAGRYDELIAAAAPARLATLQFAAVAACHEHDLTTHGNIWRTDDQTPERSLRARAVEWLTLCESLGYTPTPIERAVIDGTPYDPDTPAEPAAGTDTDDTAPTLTD